MAFLIERGRGLPTEVVTPQVFNEIVDSKKQYEDVAYIRQSLKNMAFHEQAGNKEEAKKWKTEAGRRKAMLPGWVFQARCMVDHEWIDSKKVNHGTAAWRHQDWAMVNGLAMCDFDHIPDPRKAWAEINPEALKLFNVLFAYVTPSGQGLKVVFEAHPDGDIAANQQAFAEAVGIKVDEVCFDASRLSFATTRDDILYFNKKIFELENEKFKEQFTEKYFKGVTHPDMFGGARRAGAAPAAGDSAGKHGGKAADVAGTAAVQEGDGGHSEFEDYTYCGIRIEDIITKLIGDAPVMEGKRHQTIFDTAKLLRYVCERSASVVKYFLMKLDWVKGYDDEHHDVDKAIEDAMNKPYSSFMPKSIKEALKELGYSDEEKKDITEDLKPFKEYGERLQEFFDYYPCLRDVCAGLDVGAYPAAVYTAAAFFGTLMTRTWYRFWFQPSILRRLNYAVFIIGDPGCGKSFAGDLFNMICEPMIVADKVGTDAINAYKKERLGRSTSDKEKKKEALVAPENIIRIHGPRTANGVFIEDMVNAKEIVDGEMMHLHLLTFSSELDAITQANKGGQWIDKSTFELLAFHNETDNQQYKNVESVSGPFDVFWNFVYTGTPIALRKKVNERNFGTGLFSRLGCLPMASDYFVCAEEGKVTKAEEARRERIKKWAYELDKVRGELPLEPIVHETHEFVNEIMTLAEIEDNKAEAFLVKRVPYYGVNITAPFILMRHYKEWQEKRTFKCDKKDVAFCRLILELQMEAQRFFFGSYAEKYFQDSIRDLQTKQYAVNHRKSDDVYALLPETFNVKDVAAKAGISEEGARVMIHRWVKSNMAVKISLIKKVGTWKKVS